MKWLFKNFMKKGTFFYIFALILEISGALVSNIWPVTVAGKIIDIGINQNNPEEIIKLFILGIAVFLIGRLMAYFGVIIIDSKTFDLCNDLGIEMSKKLFYLDNDYFQKTTVGEMNTILTKDIRNFKRFIGYTIKQFTHEILVSLFCIIYCMTINFVMGLVLLLFMPLFIFVTMKFKQKTKNLYKVEREKTSKLNSYIQENIEGNRLIKNLGTEEKEINKFRNLNEDYVDYKIKISYKMYSYTELIRFLSYFLWTIMILLGGIFIVNGSLTIGQFMIFNGYIGVISRPLYYLIEYMDDFQNYKISLKKVKNLFNTKAKQKDEGRLELNSINEIKFKNVEFEVEDKKVLSDINFTLNKNKTYAFIGEVGSGKSSIGRLILRIIDRTKGEILINDKKIDDYPIYAVRDKIAYVAQTPFLFSDSIKNNVNFGNLELTDNEIRYYLKLAKADYVDKLEEDIETVIGENGISLSGGEKQRLSLARALARKPQLLILDDITSALDYESELEVTKNINNLDYDCTKIIIAQKIISVKNADIIFVMKSGKIIAEGTHEELLDICDFYKEIYDIQSGAVSKLEYA